MVDAMNLALGINEIPSLNIENARFQVFPNPGRDHFKIEMNLDHPGDVNFELISLEGMLIRTINTGNQPSGKTDLPLDLSGIPGGIYLLKCTNGTVQQFKTIEVLP